MAYGGRALTSVADASMTEGYIKSSRKIGNSKYPGEEKQHYH